MKPLFSLDCPLASLAVPIGSAAVSIRAGETEGVLRVDGRDAAVLAVPETETLREAGERLLAWGRPLCPIW